MREGRGKSDDRGRRKACEREKGEERQERKGEIKREWEGKEELEEERASQRARWVKVTLSRGGWWAYSRNHIIGRYGAMAMR